MLWPHRRQAQLEKHRLFELYTKAATRIQHLVRASNGRYSASLRATELRLMKRARIKAAVNIQRYYRGHCARDVLFRLRAQKWKEIRAAVVIQKTFRGSRIMRWRGIRMNVVAAHILDRSTNEFQTRQLDCRFESLIHRKWELGSWFDFCFRARYKLFCNQIQDRSIFEDERFPGMDQTKVHDFQRTLARDLLHKVVKVFWPAEDRWFDGQILSWDEAKQKHKYISSYPCGILHITPLFARIQYADGDLEWIHIESNQHRIQLWLPTNVFNDHNMFSCKYSRNLWFDHRMSQVLVHGCCWTCIVRLSFNKIARRFDSGRTKTKR